MYDYMSHLGTKEEMQSFLDNSSKIIKIYDKHPEMRKLLYRIPEILHDPVIIMDSPVIVSLLPHPINRNGYQLDVHKITSAYAKDNAQREQNRIYF